MKIISQIIGGLGNQMFQYACGRNLALRLGAEYKLDLSWFRNNNTDTKRSYMLDVFPIAAGEATGEECKHLIWGYEPNLIRRLREFRHRPRKRTTSYVLEPHFHYWKGFENLKGSKYLAGYWQSEKYFAPVADQIRLDFTFPELPVKSADIANHIIATKNSVMVHIRRGDYVDHVLHDIGLSFISYYQQAIEYIVARYSSPSLFIFSDGPEWVHDNFVANGLNTFIVNIHNDESEAHHDMHLMSLCRHHILANSSFSWWGAWLSQKGGIVCAPRKWFNATEMDTSDLPLRDWVLF